MRSAAARVMPSRWFAMAAMLSRIGIARPHCDRADTLRREEGPSFVLDRLISGAGAVTDAADRVVRAAGRGGGERLLGHRPGSVLVAAACVVLAGILVLTGLEATDNPTAVTLTPDQVAQADDLGGRTYATISGTIAAEYVETFADDNGNGTQEAGEAGISWFYFLVDPTTRAGLTIRSTRSPADLFMYEAAGVVVEDAAYVKEDLSYFADEQTTRKFGLDPVKYLDATVPVASTTPVIDLADGIPAADTPIRIAGARAGTYVTVCSGDANGDGICQDSEVDLWDVAVFDPPSGIGITVLVDTDPEFTPATFTGMLRRDERSVSEAKSTDGLDFSTLALAVTDTYLLDADRTPASAPIAFGLAALLGLLAGLILIGLSGGYLVYRQASGSLPAPATTLGVGEHLPLRVTGSLRTSSGLVHVREVDADLVRFQTSGPVTAPVDDAPSQGPVDVGSTLIIERRGRPEGVALGLGELTGLSRGDIVPFRGRRPGLRATAGTGRLLLSFASQAERDRAVAELLDETGLVADQSGSARA